MDRKEGFQNCTKPGPQKRKEKKTKQQPPLGLVGPNRGGEGDERSEENGWRDNAELQWKKKQTQENKSRGGTTGTLQTSFSYGGAGQKMGGEGGDLNPEEKPL